MRQSPNIWVFKNIKDVLSPLDDGKVLHQGWSPRCEPQASTKISEWAALKTTAIQDGWFDDSFNKRLPSNLSPKPNLEVRAGDILMTCAGPRDRCGVACLVTKTRPRLMISGKMYRFRANESVMKAELLLAYLRSSEGQAAIDRMKTGGNESGLNLTHERFFQLQVPVAPLNEQPLIVAKMASLFGHSNGAREELVRLPRLVERHKQAVLSEALRNGVAGVGKKQLLGDLCDRERGITYGVIKLGAEVSKGVPCLRTSNVRWLHIDTEGMKRISPALSEEYGRTVLRGGEVLVNVRGTLGGVAVASPSMKGWNVSREVAVVPVDADTVDPDYIAYWIGSDSSQLWLRGVQKGVAYTGINLSDLRKLEVELPPIEKQREIVQHIREAHSRDAKLGNEVERAQGLLYRIDQTVFAKAFRGDLIRSRQPAGTRSSGNGRGQ